MKKRLFSFLFILCLVPLIKAQDISVIVHDYTLQDTLGVEQIIFHFEVINISESEQAVFEVRTVEELPDEWTSSMCFGETCFPPEIDSIVTGPPFPDPPLQIGDTLFTSLYVNPVTNVGTGHVQIQIGTLRNPNDRVTLDFYATAIITDVNDLLTPFAYSLDQNYPNPFNPSTVISYSLAERGNVNIKLYDVLGNEIGDLLNEEKESGNYNLTFDTRKFELSSGVYFYTIRVNDFVQTRKMILEK